MRTFPAALAVLSLSIVALTGCTSTSSDPAHCQRPPVDESVTDLITVSGSTSEKPNVDVFAPFHTSTNAAELLEPGSGTAITSARQLVVLDISIFSGKTGDALISTEYNGDLTRVGSVEGWSRTFPTIEQDLYCARAGSRVLMALAPGDINAEVATGIGLATDESAVVVMDVHKVYRAHAEGPRPYNAAAGLPAVVRAPDGRPGITVPRVDPPTELVTQTLISGDGKKVNSTDAVRAHYTAVEWSSGEQRETTWDSEPVSLTSQTAVPGLIQALEGATVGSQLLVVVPPELGYGEDASEQIPATSTLVYVVDILGVDVPSA